MIVCVCGKEKGQVGPVGECPIEQGIKEQVGRRNDANL